MVDRYGASDDAADLRYHRRAPVTRGRANRPEGPVTSGSVVTAVLVAIACRRRMRRRSPAVRRTSEPSATARRSDAMPPATQPAGTGPGVKRRPWRRAECGPTDLAIARIETVPSPCELAEGLGLIWVTSYAANEVVAIDPATNEVTDDARRFRTVHAA